ncbi:hypothetical protein [Hirschia litorea]|uniref:DUF11 domain-containing protein n=1 Tax=Hirschia litorea TaxID=1199156 RepID=A0ABW2IPD2_9PROT
MRILYKTPKSALPLLCSTILMAGSAHAVGTDAGKSVENTFTLDYQVSNVDQGTITNDPNYTAEAGDPSPVINPAGPTNFTVDRMIDLSVTANNSNLIVPSNAQDRVLEFSVTNLGNDYQSYSFSVADVAGDDFDATDLQLTYSRAAYDLNGDGDTSDACEGEVVDAALTATVVGTAAGSASYTCDIPADLPFTVKISGDIPSELGEQSVDNLVLVAETRNPSQWVFEGSAPSVGGVSAKDGDSANTIDGVAENVFADGSGSSEEANEDGLMSAPSSYVVTSPDLVAEKRVWVLETDSDVSGCNALAIPSSEPTTEYPTPGACVLYTIEVRNTGEVAGSDAENLDIVDLLPSDIAFVSATTNGFSTPGTLTYKKADGTTDCDGAAAEDCTVSLIATSLDAQVGATDTVAQLYIRALVR